MKAIRSLILLVLIFFILDRLLGAGLGWMYSRTTSGEAGGLLNEAIHRNSDILILGSSRAKHHVVPAVLKEELGFSAYNAGLNGQDMLYALLLLELKKEKPAPKVILIHIDPNAFSYKEQEMERLSVLSYYVDQNEQVAKFFKMRGPYETVKLLSSSYRFNGKVLSIIKNYFKPMPVTDGYEALPSSLLETEKPSPAAEILPSEAWKEKTDLFASTIKWYQSKGTKVFLFISPSFSEGGDAMYDKWLTETKQFLKVYPDVAFLDLSQHFLREFSHSPTYFKDSSHLNGKGSEIFTRALASQLKPFLTNMRK